MTDDTGQNHDRLTADELASEAGDLARHWHYAATVQSENGHESWSVSEVYSTTERSVWGYTEKERPDADTIEDLETILEMMLNDVRRHILDLRGSDPILRNREQ